MVEQGQPCRYAYELDGRGSIPGKWALRPTKLPIQWVPGAISPGVKLPKRDADHSPPPIAGVKNGGAIPPLPRVSSRHNA
jgi:hypothetical protein